MKINPKLAHILVIIQRPVADSGLEIERKKRSSSCFIQRSGRNTQIQPLVGEPPRCIVPAPSGIRAVGDGAALLPLSVRVSGLADPGVLGSDAVVGEPTDVVGVTGFIRSPLTQAGGGTAGCEGGAEGFEN
jgi:hypothetical protein